MPDEPAVRFENVRKHFAEVRALDDVSFEVPVGCRLGMLGPNGSGKTTALRLMLGLFRPESGEVRVLGEAAGQRSAERIGYLPEERGLYREMRVLDVLRYYAKLKGVVPSEHDIDEWLQRLEIDRFKHHKIRALSKGTSQKVQFVATVLHDPELLILDEPFSGLDPLSRQTLRAAIVHLTQQGKTLIFSTHDMSAAEDLCDHFLMLHRGNKVLDASRAALGNAAGSVALELESQAPLCKDDLPGVVDIVQRGYHATLTLRSGQDPQPVVAALLQRQRVSRFSVGQRSLEDLFLSLAGATQPDAEPGRANTAEKTAEPKSLP